jgi:hypothetical protein
MGLLYAFVAFFLFVVIWAVVNQFRLRRLRRKRQANGFNRDQSIEAFLQLGIPDNIPATVYDYYGSQKAWKDFPFSPDDRYSEVLHDDPDDLDDDASALVHRLGMRMLTERARREYGDKPIKPYAIWCSGWTGCASTSQKRNPTERTYSLARSLAGMCF